MKNSSTKHTPDALLHDLRTLLSEAEKMMGDTVSENAEEAISSMRERFEAAHDRFNEMYLAAKKKVIAGAHYTDETIRSHPYQTIAIAAGVGVLVGVLVGRRCSK